MTKKKVSKKIKSQKKTCNYNSNEKKKKNRTCGICKTVMDYFFPPHKKKQ
jgi:cytidine deaminase